MQHHLFTRGLGALMLALLGCERAQHSTTHEHTRTAREPQDEVKTLAIMRAGEAPLASPRAHIILSPDQLLLRDAAGTTRATLKLDAQTRASIDATRRPDLPALTDPLITHLGQQREEAERRCWGASPQDELTHCADVKRAVVWIEAPPETPFALVGRALASASYAEGTHYALLVRAPDGALRAINGTPPKFCGLLPTNPSAGDDPFALLQSSREPCVMPELTLTREGLRMSAHDSVEDWSCGAGIIARASPEEAPLIGPRDASGLDLEAARAALRALSQREALCPHVTLRARGDMRWDEVVQVADLAREGAPERHVSWSLIRDEVQPPQ